MVDHIFTDSLNEIEKQIRYEVFTLEQGFAPEIDVDNHDEHSTHILIFVDGNPAATGRIFKESEGIYHLGRLAVLKRYRKMNIGRYAVSNLVEKVKEKGARKVILGAQIDKIGFYEKVGFSKDIHGEIFLDGGAPHMMMEMKL